MRIRRASDVSWIVDSDILKSTPDSQPPLAKTSRPRLVAVYQRARLFDQLTLSRQHYLATLVSGPPGSGKTTLVSSYLELRNLRCLWYQVDAGDEDVATFFYYFGQAAREFIHADAPMLPVFDPATAGDSSGFARNYFRHLFSRLRQPIVVVFDNYQDLTEDSPLHQVIATACEEIQRNCHFIFTSRELCPKPLSRMRFNHTIMIIGSEDLALTAEETFGIARLHRVELPSISAAQTLQTRCGGWMIGVMLALECIAQSGKESSLESLLPFGQEEILFDYFAGEVFKKLNKECRELLMQMALLPKMTIRRVSRLTGTPRAAALLRDLMRKNLFVTRHPGEEAAYQFHPLFRQFLLGQGTTYFETDFATHRGRAAEVVIADGDDEAAIELLEQAQDSQRMEELILANAPTLKAQGRDATIELWLAKLPKHRIDSNPWLLYWCGCSIASTDPGGSQAFLERAYAKFSEQDDVLGMALSWSGVVDAIITIHRDLKQVDPWIVEFQYRIEARRAQLPSELCARIDVAYFVALSFRQPLHPDIAFWMSQVRAMLEAERRAEERAALQYHLVRYHILRGEHATAESMLNMQYVDKLPMAERPTRTTLDYLSEATVALHTGMTQRCFAAVTEGLHAAEASANRHLRSVLLQIGAVMSLNRGDLTGTESYLASFERCAEPLPVVDRGAYFAVAAWRKFYSGEPPLAMELLGRAVAASETRGTPYYIAADYLGYGLMLHLCGKTTEALHYLHLGREVGRTIKNALIEYAYELFSAYTAIEQKHDKEAHEHLVNGLRIGRENGYMHFFYFPPGVVARLCLRALESEIESEYVRSLIERNELTPDPTWRQSEFWPWPIRIYTFGRFGVVKQGVTLRFNGKAQKKPLELLKVLIALGGREVHEAKLADVLWPEAEGDAAAQSLATTLFRLRKLLSDRVIRRQDSRLTLDPRYCWVDCWEFERVANDDSQPAQWRLPKLRKIYQGPFLEGTDDALWAIPMRQRLVAKFDQVAGMAKGRGKES